jgi:hypothetical protein
VNRWLLVAGWPFAGLLALCARPADSDSRATLRSGIVMEHDGQGGALVLESDGATGRIEINEATALYGVDGYPIAIGNLPIGYVGEAVQEKRGEEWITTEIHVVWPSSSPGLDWT